MKRVLLFLLACVFIFLIVSYFIPSVRQKEIPVKNTADNIISSIFKPRDWIKWDASVKRAWSKDSSSCVFLEDTAKHLVRIVIPGKTITVSQVSYIFYKIEEADSDQDTSYCALSVIPAYTGVGIKQTASERHAGIAYIYNSRLLYKIFPFLEEGSISEKNIAGLKTFLEDDNAFYGFPISIQQANDTMFLTRKILLTKQELFQKLPVLFDSLEQCARNNKLVPGSRNVYYSILPHDSLDILAGININKSLMNERRFQFMQMPAGQFLAIGHFEGPFYERPRIYAAIRKYIADRQLVRLGVCFEKYLSPLPVSDSSPIKMELSFPLRFY